MTETKRIKVFLCHAHSDATAVRNLFRYLRREGVDVWLDKESLLPGAQWDMEIRKAVRASDVVIVCLSRQFNQAGYRQKEVRIALDTEQEKPEGSITFIEKKGLWQARITLPNGKRKAKYDKKQDVVKKGYWTKESNLEMGFVPQTTKLRLLI
jgi:hypothetical protein